MPRLEALESRWLLSATPITPAAAPATESTSAHTGSTTADSSHHSEDVQKTTASPTESQSSTGSESSSGGSGSTTSSQSSQSSSRQTTSQPSASTGETSTPSSEDGRQTPNSSGGSSPPASSGAGEAELEGPDKAVPAANGPTSSSAGAASAPGGQGNASADPTPLDSVSDTLDGVANIEALPPALAGSTSAVASQGPTAAVTGGKSGGMTVVGAETATGDRSERNSTWPGLPQKSDGEAPEQTAAAPVDVETAPAEQSQSTAQDESTRAVAAEPLSSGLITRLPLVDAEQLDQGLREVFSEVESLSNALFSNQAVLLWLAGMAAAGLACELSRRQLRQPSLAATPGSNDPSSCWFLGDETEDRR
jgi:hypothetical protein